MSASHDSARPQAMPVVAEHIPDALRELPQWLAWQYVQDIDRETGEVSWDKPPISARNGGPGSSTNAATWTTFVAALDYCRERHCDGIGFALHCAKDEPARLVAIDLDKCREPQTGVIDDWALAVIRAIHSYSEVSPSGRGIRIFLWGALPAFGRKKGPYENYESGRYVTVTGQHIGGTPRTIESRQEQLLRVHQEQFGERLAPQPRPTNGVAGIADLDNRELLERAFRSKSGVRIRALFSGETSGYLSRSEADLALCNHLAFWFGRDADRMMSVIAESGLYRTKWQREDYRERTLRIAIEGCSEIYEPRAKRANGTAHHSKTNGDAAGRENGPDNKPQIIIDVDEERVNTEAVAAVAHDRRIFQRGNMLVHVLRDEAKTKGIIRPPGAPRIVPMPSPVLRELLASAASWQKVRAGRNGELIFVPSHPPEWTVANVASRGCWPDIRYLEAIAESPTLRHDGTILDQPGWDAATGLLYEPRITFPTVPQHPTQEAARASAETLLDLIADFPLAGIEHRVAWLAALLTPLARFAFTGPAPLFLFTANAPGSGKTLLAWLIAEIVEGREMARTPYPVKDDEMRKTITAVALSGDKLMLLDNIDSATPFGCASLDAALTGTTWKERILGVSEMTPDLPLFTVWLASGNNVSLRGDIHRRVIPCRLETSEEHPEARQGFRHPDLIGYARGNRAALVVAALTILRAYFAAGKPPVGLTPLGSYEQWSATVRAAVAWATGYDPAGTRAGITESDDALSTLAGVLEGWAQLPGGTSDEGLTVAEALRFVKGDREMFAVLHDALMGWSRKDELPAASLVGYRLRALRGRVLHGRAMHGAADRNKVVRWRVAKPRDH